MMKIIFSIVLLVLLSVPVIVSAGFYYCPVISDTGQDNEHDNWKSSMSDWGATLEDELNTENDNGKSLVTAQKKITSSFSETSKGYISAISAAFAQHAIALSSYESQVDYSPHAKSLDACSAKEGAAGIAQGQVLANDQYSGLLETTQSVSKQTDTIKAAKKINAKLADPEEVKIENYGRLFPSNNQIAKDETEQIAETIILATDPLPYPILIDEKQKNAPAGQKYMATKQIKDLHVSLAQQALDEIVSKKMAVYDLKDWSANVSPLLASQLPEGKLSADQVLDLQVGSRYKDPNRVVRIHELSQTGLYRELVTLQAVNLEISRRILRHAEKEVFIQASAETLSTNLEMLPELSESYSVNIKRTHGD